MSWGICLYVSTDSVYLAKEKKDGVGLLKLELNVIEVGVSNLMRDLRGVSKLGRAAAILL